MFTIAELICDQARIQEAGGDGVVASPFNNWENLKKGTKAKTS